MDKNIELENGKLIAGVIVNTTKFKEALLNRQFGLAQRYLQSMTTDLELLRFLKEES